MQMDKPVGYKGSKVHLDSHFNWAVGLNIDGTLKLNYRNEIPRGCCIHLPAHTEMVTFPYVFYKQPDQPMEGAEACKQRILVTEVPNFINQSINIVFLLAW